MKYVKEIIPYVKIFLFAFLVIAQFPIHHLTGSNFQSYFAHSIYVIIQYNNIVNILFRTIIAILFVTAYQTKDAMLFCLLLYFTTHKTAINKEKNDDKTYSIFGPLS